MNRAPNPSEPFGQSPSQPLPVPEWWLAAGTGPVARPPQVVQPQSLPVSQPSQWNPYQGTRPPGPVMIPRQFGRAMAPLPGEVSDAMSQPALPAGPSAWPQARVSMGPGPGMPRTAVPPQYEQVPPTQAAAPGMRMPGLEQPQWGAGRAAERGLRGPRKRRIIAAFVAALAVGTALNQAVIQPQLRVQDAGSGSWLQAVKEKKDETSTPGGGPQTNPAEDSGWQSPIHAEDLNDKTAGLSQCWMHYYYSPTTGKSGYHAALDIKVKWKPVYAPHKGKVYHKYDDDYNTLIIDTGIDPESGKRLYAVFMHMSKITVGKTVEKGQQIGVSGDEGAPGAPHLHWGITDDPTGDNFGVYANPWHTANPLDFLPADTPKALFRTDDYSCKTDSIRNRSDFGLKKYKTKGSFPQYK